MNKPKSYLLEVENSVISPYKYINSLYNIFIPNNTPSRQGKNPDYN